MADSYYNNEYWPDVVTCAHCGHTARPVHKYPFPPETVFCPFCGAEVEFRTVRRSHGDSIRAMSDEELAGFFPSTASEWSCHPGATDADCRKAGGWWQGCPKCWLDWLKSKAEVE